MSEKVQFQTIQFIILTVFCLLTAKCKTVIFQTIRFSIRIFVCLFKGQNSSVSKIHFSIRAWLKS